MATHKQPAFEPVFEELRASKRHLLFKNRETAEMQVSDSEIGQLAEVLLGSHFYCEPWLEGCEPATVLFKNVIDGLSDDNPETKRQAVNSAFQAEHRILAMGLDFYIAWRRAGMPALAELEVEKPKTKRFTNKHPSKQVSLPLVKEETASNLLRIWEKNHLLDEMPERLLKLLKQAVVAMKRGKLAQPTAEAIEEAVRQWLRLRKEQRDRCEATKEARKMGASAIQQYVLMLDLCEENDDRRLREQLQDILDVITAGDPKALASVLRAGDRLHGLLCGTILPVEPLSASQDLTNIADANYTRSRLGHLEAPQRGKAMPRAGKTRQQLSRKGKSRSSG